MVYCKRNSVGCGHGCRFQDTLPLGLLKPNPSRGIVVS
jgi:hypothetical protein